MGGYLYLGAIGTAVGYWLWFRGVSRLPATSVAFLTLLSPLSAAVIGWAALGQALSPLQVLGMAIAFGGTLLGQLRGSRPLPTPTPIPDPAPAARPGPRLLKGREDMRITVFGAAGGVGSRVVAEALDRGHEVTAVVRRSGHRHDGARVRTGDAADAGEVARLSTGQDVVIAATRPAPGREHELAATAEALLTGVARTDPAARLLIVGGAATLTVPGTGGFVVDAPDFPRLAAHRAGVRRAAHGLPYDRHRRGLGLSEPTGAARTGRAHRHLPDRHRHAARRRLGKVGDLHGGPRGRPARRGRAPGPPPHEVHGRLVRRSPRLPAAVS